jgi:putative addiction module component (TIGR02574 family)
MAIQISEILELDTAEKLRVIGDIWDSIAKNPATLPLSEKERIEFDNRLRDFEDFKDELLWDEQFEKTSEKLSEIAAKIRSKTPID